jgi:hypothetical protein
LAQALLLHQKRQPAGRGTVIRPVQSMRPLWPRCRPICVGGSCAPSWAGACWNPRCTVPPEHDPYQTDFSGASYHGNP